MVDSSQTVIVRFEPDGREARVARGTTLHAAAIEAHVPIDVPCGGAGLCRGCRVTVTGEVSPLDEHERAGLSSSEVQRGVRLACVAQAEGDVEVTLGHVSRAVRAVTAFGDGAADGTGAGTGGSETGTVLGIDVGTTTLVVSLADAATGDEIAVASSGNPQARFGADVMSRIGRSEEAPAMRAEVESALATLVARVRGESGLTEAPVRAAVAGNTTMLHILAGEDPSPLGVSPYRPVFLSSRRIDAAALGLPPEVSVETLPGASAFVGADAVAGMLATHMTQREGSCLLIDMGTNGEIVLRTAQGDSIAASAAAGPAFEGGGIECGMRAVPGAVERVWLDGGDLRFSTVGGLLPTGLCGSGLLDLVSVLLDVGALAPDGRLGDSAVARVEQVDGVDRVTLTEGVWLSQRDVRNVQLAKSAIGTALEMVVAKASMGERDVDEVLVAGGFGSHVDPVALGRLAMIPDAWVDRTVFVGNAVKAGALRWAVDADARSLADEVASGVRVLDLAGDEAFQDRFVANLAFRR